MLRSGQHQTDKSSKILPRTARLARVHGAAQEIAHGFSRKGVEVPQRLIRYLSTHEGDVKMTRVRVESFTISLDGYGAGPHQDIDNPLGIGGTDLHQWLFPTRTFQRALFGKDGGTTGVDEDFASRGFQNVGAWILGRNMFAPIRGPWPDMNWKGWWGDNPPYHVPVFILTHHARPPIEMEGNTTFHFITGGIREALDRAREAAAGRDVRIGGGPNTIQQYLREGLIDELHIAIAPVLLGSGERLFEGVDLRALGYECVAFVASEKATHVVLQRHSRMEAGQPVAADAKPLDGEEAS
jgi:dihydrofolate reductase